MSREDDLNFLEEVENGNIENVEYLLSIGIDIEERTYNGEQTALIIATTHGNFEMVELLLDRGADIDARDNDGDTALMNAARDGSSEEIVELLIGREADINIGNDEGYTALMHASHWGGGFINTVRILLDRGADINLRNNDGNSALMLTVLDEHNEIAEFLLDRVADTETRDNIGDTVLMVAVYNGFTDMVNLLLYRGADINAQSISGQTALIIAEVYEQFDIAVILIREDNIDLDIQDNTGNNALMYACQFGFFEIVTLLIQRGAYIYERNNERESAIEIARSNGFYNIAARIPFREEFSGDELSVNESEDNEDMDEEDNDTEEIERFNFEDIDIDERDVNFNRSCKDLVLNDDVNIVAHLNEIDTFLFIKGNPSVEPEILCFEKSYLRSFLENKDDNWFYECTGPFIRDRNGILTNDRSMNSFGNTAYIKIPINSYGLNCFIPKVQIEKILLSSHKVYYINPMLENGIQKMITHSVSWQNSYGPRNRRNFVSANHCQSRSGIIIYNIKVCKDPERCVRSIFT